MKNKLFFVIALFVSFSNYGQNSKLDLKNGFRHFKLGTSASQIKNIKINANQISKNPRVKEYIYTGTDITTVFNVNIESITLGFFNDKLFDINVSFGNIENKVDFSVTNYKSILSSLEETYGTDWKQPSNHKEIITNGAIWSGKKVTLELFRIDYSKDKDEPVNYGFIGGYLHIFDKKLMKEMYSSDY